jgi:hypothetical protein
MSATNAISGISLVGSLVAAGAKYGPVSTALGYDPKTALLFGDAKASLTRLVAEMKNA